MFKRLVIDRWRQFEHVDIAFHSKLTILTGANGAGKTTLLNILSRHFGWSLALVGTPRLRKKGLLKYISDAWNSQENVEDEQTPPPPAYEIGSLTYCDDKVAKLAVPHGVAEQYQINIISQQKTDGIFVPSHRPAYFYQKLQTIPTVLRANDELFNVYLNELKNRFKIDVRVKSASLRLKEAIVSLATFGYGNQAVEPNADAIQTFEGFEAILRKVLPSTLGYQRIRIRLPEVVLETNTGEFSLDAVSGGVASIIDLAWQVYMSSILYGSFSVVIDEPENHLHPQLQRELLSNLLNAFPQVQFVVATHNPFIVTSVRDSYVYVLDYNERRRVKSALLESADRAGTSNDILRDVLGLENTMPIWATNELKDMLAKFSDIEISDDSLMQLRHALMEAGLSKYAPSAIAKLLEVLRDKTHKGT